MPKTFIYTGPNSAMTLRVPDESGELQDLDVILWSNRTVDLPADHEVVATMQQRGLLTPVDAIQTGGEIVPEPTPETAPTAPAAKTSRAK